VARIVLIDRLGCEIEDPDVRRPRRPDTRVDTEKDWVTRDADKSDELCASVVEDDGPSRAAGLGAGETRP
jgi:hypothetical protein